MLPCCVLVGLKVSRSSVLLLYYHWFLRGDMSTTAYTSNGPIVTLHIQDADIIINMEDEKQTNEPLFSVEFI